MLTETDYDEIHTVFTDRMGIDLSVNDVKKISKDFEAELIDDILNWGATDTLVADNILNHIANKWTDFNEWPCYGHSKDEIRMFNEAFELAVIRYGYENT